MQTYYMEIQYDGSRYKGWQRLGGDDAEKTIQGKIEKVLERFFEQAVEIHGASRTDAGVHSLKQCASFSVATQHSAKAIHNYLLTYLPEDIAVQWVKSAPPRFHARYSAKSKTYEYRIYNAKVLDPFIRKYVAHEPTMLNVHEMRRAAEYLVGKHDFTTFTNVRSKKKSMERTIHWVKVERRDQIVYVTINGDGFLHNMVRKIAGMLIEVGKENIPATRAVEILGKKDRALCPGMAPAEGLFLVDIEY